jgi:hypothetical protein
VTSFTMSPPLSGQGKTTPPLPTTKGSKDLRAKILHFDTVLLQQDLLKKAEDILTILKGDDMRAIKKLHTSMADVVTGLCVAMERLSEITALRQQKREFTDFLRAKCKETNATIKIQQRNIPVEKRKSPEEVRIEMILKDCTPPVRKKLKKLTPALESRDDSTGPVEQFCTAYPPSNKSHYTFFELVNGLLINEESPIHGMSVRKVYDLLHEKSLVVGGRTTLSRHCTNYTNKGVLPSPSADGSTLGRPNLLDKENISLLNQNILAHVGSTSDTDGFGSALAGVVAQQRQSQGLAEVLVTPKYDPKTQKKYFQASATMPGVALVPAGSVRTQGHRRQMAASSERNLLSHAVTVMDQHFVPGAWHNKPKNLSAGAKLTHELVEKIRGQRMRPVEPYQVINYDITTEYIGAGAGTRRTNTSTEYVKISNDSLATGKRSVASAYRLEWLLPGL